MLTDHCTEDAFIILPLTASFPFFCIVIHIRFYYQGLARYGPSNFLSFCSLEQRSTFPSCIGALLPLAQRFSHNEGLSHFIHVRRRCRRRQGLGESVVPRVELYNVCPYPTSLMPPMFRRSSSYPETETITTYTTVTTCPLTISSGSAYHTTLTTSTIVVTSCKGGCHKTATPPPPLKTTSIGTAPLPPPSVTAPPPKPSKGTSVVASSVPPPPETPIYSNVRTLFGKWDVRQAKEWADDRV